MNKLRAVIAEHVDPLFRPNPELDTHVEIVDEYGFAGYDPTGTDILQAYIVEYGHSPRTDKEIAEFGNLVIRTAAYHHQLFQLATDDIDHFGIEENDLWEASQALSLDTEHSFHVWPQLAAIKRTRSTEE